MTLTVHTDINAIQNNLCAIKKQCRAITFMVKADAYNHGMAVVARHTEHLVDGFGVANADEGRELRASGIKKQILVTAFGKEEIADAVFYGLVPVVSDIDTLLALDAYAKIKDVRISFDLKIDSGMNRYGIKSFADAHRALGILAQNKRLKLRALATHMAHQDRQNIDAQLAVYNQFYAIFGSYGYNIRQHFANSAVLSSGYFVDEARVGMLAYGYPSGQPAMTVTVPISQIRLIKKGDQIGYSGLYCAPKDVKIGLLKAGYYDGIPRNATGATVLVNNQRTKIVANVCMDCTFLLLDGIAAQQGDNAVLLGGGLPLDLIENDRKTIVYEIMTAFTGRKKRIYYL